MRILLLIVATGIVVSCATKNIQLHGGSIADQALQRKAAQLVMLRESTAQSRCALRKIVNTEVEELPATPDKDPWIEHWTVDRCGSLVYYKVVFNPEPAEKTDVSVMLWE